MRIYIIGMPGSGKTYFGRKLSSALKMSFTDLDDKITEVAGMSIKEIIDLKGENAFRLLEKECLKATEALNHSVISCGGGTPAFFDNMDWIKKHGISIWLNTPLSGIFERIRRNQSRRPAFAGLSGDDMLIKINSISAQRKVFYEKADIMINESQQTGKALTKALLLLRKKIKYKK
ncbi:MAG: shikimate kinase [Bacteroidia bacterium]|nr:shikimate kinase [Bacteroidia bacterium]